MDIYNERRQIAENLRKIYIELYNSLNDKCIYDPNLEDIPSSDILDFGLYTSGFIGVTSNENITETISEQEINEMLKGTFFIETYLQRDAETLMKEYEVFSAENPCPKKISLLKIQDGEYYLERDQYISSKNYSYKLMFKTDPITLEGPAFSRNQDKQPGAFDVMNIIRNTFVHTSPLIDGRFLIFITNNKSAKITATKMWLRGYTETMCRLDKSHNTYTLFSYIIRICEKSGNDLENESDLYNLVEDIKSAFPILSDSQFEKIKKFLALRVKYCSTPFYRCSLDEKVDILTDLIAHNSSYIKRNCGALNANVIYAMQQAVARQMEDRTISSSIALRDIGLERIKAILDRADKFEQERLEFNEVVKSGKFNPVIMKKKHERLTKEERDIHNAKLQIKREIDLKRKLESSDLNLVGELNVNTFAPEYAVTIISLMAYNALVTSGFYDELKTDSNYFSFEQDEFFKKVPTQGITLYRHSTKMSSGISGTAEHNYWFLASVRQALCHNGVTFVLPDGCSNKDCSIFDVKITFNNGHAGISYTGTVKSLFEIFSNPIFTNERDSWLKTQKFELDYEFNTPEMEKLEKEILEHPNTFIRRVEQGDEE